MAVDLGTANTLVYVRGRGIVLNEPSVVATNTNTGEILAVGVEAKRMIGRTPANIVAIRPLKDGVIADFDTTERMLRYFIRKVHRRRYLVRGPRVVVCVPSGITGVEQRAVKEATYAAGASKVFIIEEPMAAAIGAGLPVSEPTGNMVVDIGGGTTEVAVISLGGIVTNTSHPDRRRRDRPGDHPVRQEGVLAHARRAHLRGDQDRHRVGVPDAGGDQAEIRGRDLVTGLPKTIVVSGEEIRRAIEEPVNAIVDAVKTTLDKCPPELSGDIMDRGIVLDRRRRATCAAWTSGSGTRPGCRSSSPTTRCTRSRSAPAAASRTSTRCSRCWSPSGSGTDPGRHRSVRSGRRWRAGRCQPPAAVRRHQTGECVSDGETAPRPWEGRRDGTDARPAPRPRAAGPVASC